MSDPSHDLIEKERKKYEQMWELKAYRASQTNVPQVSIFIDIGGIPAGSTVADIGCGPGYASLRFHEYGMKVVALDIAANALTDEARRVVDFHCGSVWEIPEGVSADYGFCTDMMEHIPTEKVDQTLTSIRKMVANCVYFEISLRHDKSGAAIGEVLHMTVQSTAWWTDAMGKHWKTVEVIRENPRDKSVVLLAIP